MDGWIKIHRRITESGFWTDSYAVHLWVHLLINATYQPKKTLFNGKIVQLKEGQLITGRKKLSFETGISEQIIRKWLELFEINQQITIEKTNAGSCISIVNFKLYQQDNQQRPRNLTSDQPAVNQRSTNDQPLLEEIEEGKELKENKEEKKEEAVDTAPDDWALLMKKWVAYRKEKKKPLTPSGIPIALNEIKEMSGGNIDVAQKIVNKSISSGWQGLFPLDNYSKPLTPTSKPIMKNGNFGKL